MTREEIMQLQRKLKAAGLYKGAIDGVMGPNTKAAQEVWDFQNRPKPPPPPPPPDPEVERAKAQARLLEAQNAQNSLGGLFGQLGRTAVDLLPYAAGAGGGAALGRALLNRMKSKAQTNVEAFEQLSKTASGMMNDANRGAGMSAATRRKGRAMVNEAYKRGNVGAPFPSPGYAPYNPKAKRELFEKKLTDDLALPGLMVAEGVAGRTMGALEDDPNMAHVYNAIGNVGLGGAAGYKIAQALGIGSMPRPGSRELAAIETLRDAVSIDPPPKASSVPAKQPGFFSRMMGGAGKAVVPLAAGAAAGQMIGDAIGASPAVAEGDTATQDAATYAGGALGLGAVIASPTARALAARFAPGVGAAMTARDLGTFMSYPKIGQQWEPKSVPEQDPDAAALASYLLRAAQEQDRQRMMTHGQ